MSPNAFREKARGAAAEISALSLDERARRCGNLKRAILGRLDEIVERLTRDTGKPRTDALVSEVFSTLDYLNFLEEQAPKVLAQQRVPTPVVLFGKRSRIRYDPLGTVLVISPWNYPFYLGLVPSLSAFAAGNAVLYKPSEWTPLEGLLEGLFAQAGIDESWIQVIYGDGAVASALIETRPERIVFTGSVATGRKVLAQAAPHLIPVTLELGGKDPMIVFADADLDRAAAGALWGGLTNLGQSCTSVERLYIQRPVFDDLKARLVARASRLTQKTDRDTAVDLGKMTTPFQVDIIRRQLEEAVARGARVLTGASWDGKSPEIPPIVVEGMPADCALLREETFGPVLPLVPFDSEAEALALANDSAFGLSASVWTKDPARADRMVAALKTGNVSVNNVMLTEGNPWLPFGGVGSSGFGRTKGVAGLRELTNIKSVLYDKNAKKFEANWFPYTREKYRLFRELTLALFQDGWMKIFRFLVVALQLESVSQKAGKGAGQELRSHGGS
jgi:acyl-CoA reductase-like NAD-dependent aldehyde dehydrogenase